MQPVQRAYLAVVTAMVMVSLLTWALAPRDSVAQADTVGVVPLCTREQCIQGSAITSTEQAYFKIGFEGEADLTFTILLTDAAKIQEARDIVQGVQTDAVSVLGTVVKTSVFYNPYWSYHLAPESVEFFESAIEVCDAHPQYVEEHLDEVCGAFLPGCTWCPWSSVVVEEIYMHRVFLPIVLREVCETHTAAMALATTATVLEVGEMVTVTATLANVGCADLGMPQYQLYTQSESSQPIFEPNPPTPILHLVGIHPGEADAAEFVLRAVGPGEATLSASASFEVHLGYPGPAYWGGSSSAPLMITVMPTTTTPTPTETPPTLMVHKMAEPEAVAPGDVITYTVVVMNDELGGADPGTSVVLTDSIPAHTTYISGTASSGAQYDAAADRITWAGAVPQGLSIAVSFQVRVDDYTPAGEDIENVALVRDAFGRVYERRCSVRRENH